MELSGAGELWPMDKALSRLNAFESPGKSGYAAILTTGAMNPPHRGHVQLLHQAAARLEQQGYSVLGAWLSPSHDGYVQPKAKRLYTIGLSAGFRLECARLISMNDELVNVGRWEAMQPGGWPDFPVVTGALIEELKTIEQLAEARKVGLTVFYACGTDHASNCGLYRGIGDRKASGVVVVPREGETPKGESPDKLVFVAQPADGEVASFSSTKVREAIPAETRDTEYLDKSMSPDAAQFLLHPSPEQHAAFKDDFVTLNVAAP